MFLGGIRDDGEKTVVGGESLRNVTSLGLKASQIIKVLGFGGIKRNGQIEVGESVGDIAFFGKKIGKGVSNVGGFGIELGGKGKIGNSISKQGRIGIGETLINTAALIVATIVVGEFFDGLSSSKD